MTRAAFPEHVCRAAVAILSCLFAASAVKAAPLARPAETAHARDATCSTDREAYQAGQVVRFRCHGVKDSTAELSILPAAANGTVQSKLTLRRGSSGQALQGAWRLPAGLAPGAYFFRVGKGVAGRSALPFFRVALPSELHAFAIERVTHRGAPVFNLDGGMSAEYAVAKAAAELAGGTAHSWQVSAPGFGPRPVKSTPGFLAKALQSTVAAYDQVLGVDTPIDSVILSTGIPSIPYFARALKAPVLPLHFLVSVGSIAEVDTILAVAHARQQPAYATLSHDPSVHDAVAWIKLNDLPAEYRDFLRRHRVRQVFIIGSTNTDGGETKARRVRTGLAGPYAPGAIYLMYPGTSADDEASMRERLSDFAAWDVSPDFEHVVDWESGVSPVQWRNLGPSACEAPSVNSVVRIRSANLLDLYDAATFVAAAAMARNFRVHGPEASGPREIVLNPYLTAHPAIEAWERAIPVVFWQANPVADTAERSVRLAKQAIEDYFPGSRLDALRFRLSLSRNFGGSIQDTLSAALTRAGASRVVTSDIDIDDVWNPADGLRGLTEAGLQRVLDTTDAVGLQRWNRAQRPIGLADLQKLTGRLPGLDIASAICSKAVGK